MRRCFIIEKQGDILRQYWLWPELDYPDDPIVLDKILARAIGRNLMRPYLYDTANAKLIFWDKNQSLYDLDGETPLPSREVFPFPRRNIKTGQDLIEYNRWLTNEFYKYVIKMNNITSVMPGWEKVTYKQIIPFLPVPVNINQSLVDEVVSEYYRS